MHEACIIAYKASCKVIQNNRNRRKKRRDLTGTVEKNEEITSPSSFLPLQPIACILLLKDEYSRPCNNRSGLSHLRSRTKQKDSHIWRSRIHVSARVHEPHSPASSAGSPHLCRPAGDQAPKYVPAGTAFPPLPLPL